jgi:hypothetical protein
MSRRNRVRPDGEIIAVAERGMFWGNRGCLHNPDGELVRYSRGRNWIVCLLSFKGRRRTQMRPGRLTELYFLDEVTALAAGHRPCGECRVADYRAFTSAWRSAHPDEPTGAQALDVRLHAERLCAPGVRRTWAASPADLPDGAMVTEAGRAWLVYGERLVAWSPGGYTESRPRAGLGEMVVLTPKATAETLRAGYRPVPHHSAGPASG